MSKQKPKKKIEMHQHIDIKGIPFGRSHSINVEHKHEQTQKYHNETIENKGTKG